jgi:hypothetical protein
LIPLTVDGSFEETVALDESLRPLAGLSPTVIKTFFVRFPPDASTKLARGLVIIYKYDFQNQVKSLPDT